LGDCIRVERKLVEADAATCRVVKGPSDATGDMDQTSDIKAAADQDVHGQAGHFVGGSTSANGAVLEQEGGTGEVSGLAEPAVIATQEDPSELPEAAQNVGADAVGMDVEYAGHTLKGVGVEVWRKKHLAAVLLFLAIWAGVVMLGV
jgi:hypothetical protein